MVVIQPQTRDYAPLPYTRDELTKIRYRIPNQDCLVKLGTQDAPASVDAVCSHLSTSSIVHLACHGEQSRKTPIESALILDEGFKLNLSRIMEQQIPTGSLAYLSACHTAMGDENVPDEAIHIASSLLFVGFRGVVATMW